MTNTIITELHQLSRRGQKASAEQWAALRQFLQEEHPAFVGQISRHEYGLTYQELYVCMLSRLAFTPSETAVLLGVSKQRVTNLRASINSKLFHKSGTKGLEESTLKL